MLAILKLDNYAPGTGASSSAGANYAPIPHGAASDSGQQRISKTHAHSTSLLASDSYMAGMSSDSELTSNTARHHRPYSSQSRVYHAHPAPRSSHASSRMSHYSDSATAYVPSEQTVSIKTLPAKSNHVILPNQLERQQQQHIQQQQQQQLLLTNQAQQQPIMPLQEHQAHNPINPANPYSHKHYKQHPHQNVPHQTSITSSGSGGSVSSSSSSAAAAAAAAYLALAGESPISSMLQQQQGANFIRPASGRQFGSSTTTSQRPFKQSMSIDHHSIGQYHHLHHQSPLAHPISHHQNHATQSMSSHFEPSDYHQQQNYAPTSGVLGSNQRAALMNPQGSQILSHDTRFMPQQQRNLRHEIELIEKQAGNINLYDNTTASQTANTGSLPPTASRLSSGRQLPQNPTELSVVDQQQQQPQHQQKHHQADLFASHQRMSSPADWLPPMGITTHHLNRTSGTQFKQAMSIDHYTASASQQQQQQHYSPARIPHLSEQYPPLGYPSSQICGYESPTHSAHLSGYKLANSDPHAQSENVVYQYMQEQQPDHYGSSQQLMRNQQQDSQNPHDINLQQHQHQQQHLHSSTPNFGQISSKGASSSASNQQQPRPNLQHQVSSSSSSNSQSGSLRSSNLDINKTLIDHQKTGPPPTHYQQSPQHKGGIYDQHRSHGMLRKGHTSAMSGFGVGAGFSESGDLSSSQSTAGTSGGVHLTSHGGGKRVR